MAGYGAWIRMEHDSSDSFANKVVYSELQHRMYMLMIIFYDAILFYILIYLAEFYPD